MARISKGGVSTKIIHGKKYYYFQWYEDGYKRSKTISEEEYYRIIEERTNVDSPYFDFKKLHNVKILRGEKLKASIQYVNKWKKRFCYADFNNYLDSPYDGKVMVLYGLRRTGKTVLMFQSILKHIDEIDKTAYLLADNNTSMGDINLALSHLSKLNYKYVYIDEITLAKDFISSSQFLSDIYARQMKLVLSGTDSLGFMIASKYGLYNRCYMIHTTYIPFKEFSYVLNIDDIDKYIEYGGTLVSEGINYHQNDYPTFYDEKTTLDYIDTAISKNIQNSLENYNDGEKYQRLLELKHTNKLTGVINKIVQDNNHRFVASVVNRAFKSQDYGSLRAIIRNNTTNDLLRDVIDVMDEEAIYKSLMNKLDITEDYYEQDAIDDLYTYLEAIDIIDTIPVINLQSKSISQKIVFVQPGLRYAIAKELLETLLYQETLLGVPVAVIDLIFKTLLNDAKGRILEEVVLLNEKRIKRSDVFTLSFAIGEYDMATYDRETNSCDIFEIKHSKEISDYQYRFLIDKEKANLVIKRYGSINHRVVLYRGSDTSIDIDGITIEYKNVESYLKE